MNPVKAIKSFLYSGFISPKPVGPPCPEGLQCPQYGMSHVPYPPPPLLYKLLPCPSYSRRRDCKNFVCNLITYEMKCGHIRHGFVVTFSNFSTCGPLLVHQEFFLCLMHPIGPESPISAHVACARVCRQLYVLRASHALVQATVGVGTVINVYIGVAYTGGGGGGHVQCVGMISAWVIVSLTFAGVRTQELCYLGLRAFCVCAGAFKPSCAFNL